VAQGKGERKGQSGGKGKGRGSGKRGARGKGKSKALSKGQGKDHGHEAVSATPVKRRKGSTEGASAAKEASRVDDQACDLAVRKREHSRIYHQALTKALRENHPPEEAKRRAREATRAAKVAAAQL
jgi:hypothetical protein